MGHRATSSLLLLSNNVYLARSIVVLLQWCGFHISITVSSTRPTNDRLANEFCKWDRRQSVYCQQYSPGCSLLLGSHMITIVTCSSYRNITVRNVNVSCCSHIYYYCFVCLLRAQTSGIDRGLMYELVFMKWKCSWRAFPHISHNATRREFCHNRTISSGWVW